MVLVERLASDLIELATRQNSRFGLPQEKFSEAGREAPPIIQLKVSHGFRTG
jgi:hypothetical protein